MPRILKKVLPPLAVIAVTALVIQSLSRTAPLEDGDAFVLALGGAFSAAVAVGLVYLFRSHLTRWVSPAGRRRLRGLEVSLVGFLIGLTGWLVGVYLSVGVGYAIIVMGAIVFFIGGVIHVVLFLGEK